MKLNRSRPYLFVGCIIIVLAVLAAPVPGAMGPALGGVDISDNNIRMAVVGTKEECATACDAEPACAAATFVLPNTIQGPDGHCWLKSASTPRTDNFNCYSFEKIILLPMTVGCVLSNPQADFQITKTEGIKNEYAMAPVTLYFSDMSSRVTTWSWDFGDGSPLSSEKNPVHTYTKGSMDGIPYDITLTVTGSCPGEKGSSKIPYAITVFDKVGFLELSSTPGGAQLTLDGAVLGKTPPAPNERVPLTPGSHTILLTLDGYRDYTDTFTIANGDLKQIAPVLEANPASPLPGTITTTGFLEISSTPPGAVIWLNGREWGPEPTRVTLPAGSNTIGLTKTGYTDYQTTIWVARDQTTLLNVSLIAAQGNTTSSKTSTPAITSTPVPSETVSLSVSLSPSGPARQPVNSTPSGGSGTGLALSGFSVLLVIIIVLVIAGAGWYFLKKKKSP